MSPESTRPDRPLEPPASGRPVLKWLVALVALNAVGLLWLAVRDAAPPELRLTVNALLQAGTGGVLVFAAYRALAYFAYRTLELLLMVVVLAAAMKGALEVLAGLARAGLWERRLEPAEGLGTVVQACLGTASILLAGAALGLFHCKRLGLEAPVARLWALFCGMLSLPAATGVIGFPALALAEFLKRTPPNYDLVNVFLVLTVFSVIVTARNLLYFVRAVSHRSEVERQH